MSIELYTGFVGSGKSFAATKRGVAIADAPMGKKYVIANFPIQPKRKMFHFFYKNEEKKYNKPRWIYKDNEELTVKYLVDLSLENKWNEKEGSALLIFDEASIPFNSRNFQRPDRMEWIKFLTQSRKFGYDVVFITQDSRMIDKQIRSLCEYEVVHKKLNNMNFIFKMLPWSIFAGVKYWNGLNAKYTKGSLTLSVYKKSIAERYDTLKLFDKVVDDNA